MRTDPHRPATLTTEDYEYVFSEVNHVEGWPGWVLRHGDWGMEMARWIARTDRLGRSTHQCHHCGAHLNYFAVLRHVPTGDAVVVGETCLDNRFALATREFHRLRKAAQLDRERQRIKTEREAWLHAHPDVVWLDPDEELPELVRDNDFLRDLQTKLARYGKLSHRQVEAAIRVLVKAREQADREAEEAKIVAVPAPTGRVTITGTVLGRKVRDTEWGVTRKLLVQVPTAVENGTVTEAWKLWVTEPRSLSVKRGDTVTMKVTVEPSGDDPAFAFGKRPVVA